MRKTKIEWTDRTWNPVIGCSRVSPGCVNCYAERMAARFSGPNGPFRLFADNTRSGSKWTGRVQLSRSQIEEPYRWKGGRVFVNSMSDLFHEALPFSAIDRVWQVMLDNPQCAFQVLTKRAARMAEYFHSDTVGGRAHFRNPPDWIWLGVSVENQAMHNERVPCLQSVGPLDLERLPSAVRFLSVEPLLGPVTLDLRGIHWVIVGGESGPSARPMHPDWARSIRDQCAADGVPFFFKQWGEHCYWSQTSSEAAWKLGAQPDGPIRLGKKAAGRLLDGVEHSEFPCR